jgi:hypothetical protein
VDRVVDVLILLFLIYYLGYHTWRLGYLFYMAGISVASFVIIYCTQACASLSSAQRRPFLSPGCYVLRHLTRPQNIHRPRNRLEGASVLAFDGTLQVCRPETCQKQGNYKICSDDNSSRGNLPQSNFIDSSSIACACVKVSGRIQGIILQKKGAHFLNCTLILHTIRTHCKQFRQPTCIKRFSSF